MTLTPLPLSAAGILSLSRVIPVMVIEEIETAVPLARALVEGGIRVLEITLRTDVAIEAITRIAGEVEGAVVGAGTVLDARQLESTRRAGAQFAISPGLTASLLSAAKAEGQILIPGIATLSELMEGLEAGLDRFKFFPAEAAGGIPMLKAIQGPIPGVRFCPTGGITPLNFRDYLALANVACVGGSWLSPRQRVAERDWSAITALARAAQEP